MTPDHGSSPPPEQLTQSQKMEALGRLTAGIAHEINTPMQYLGDNVTFLRKVYQDLFQLHARYRRLAELARAGHLPAAGDLEELAREETRVEPEYLESEILKTLEQSLEGVDRVTRLTLALKEYARPMRPGFAPADINRGLRNTVTISRREWKYVADLDLDLEEDLPRPHCQADEINQVLLNLIVNAGQAAKEKVDAGLYEHGKIVIQTRTAEGGIAVSVCDDGMGIAPENLAKIYDPFFTTKDAGQGSGQGLAIAWNIVVNKHRGRLTVTSERGQGTTFTLFLPLKPAAPDTPSSSPASSSSSSSSSGSSSSGSSSSASPSGSSSAGAASTTSADPARGGKGN